jgi:hypothetical protein
MKLVSEFWKNIEANELLLNRDLFRFFKAFFHYLIEIELFDDLENVNFVVEILKTEKDDFDCLPKDYMYKLGKLFSDDLILATFLEYVDWFDIDIETKKTFMQVWDYLLNVYKKSPEYANRELYILSQLKEKVSKIIENDNIKTPLIKLKKEWFPIFDIYNKPIIDLVEWDFIDIWWKWNPNEVYQKVANIDYKIFYQNRNWDILNSIEKKFKNWDEEIIINEVVINDSDWQIIMSFDKYFNRINLMTLVHFINLWNESTMKLVWSVAEKSRYDEVYISQILEFYDFNWFKFIKFSTDSFSWYDKTFILQQNWTFLVDKDNDEEEHNITNLFELEDIAWLKFVPFSYFDYFSVKEEIEFDIFPIDWYLDIKWDILKIRWNNLVEITEMQFKDYYIINWDNDFILSKKDLFKELKEYIAFNTQDYLIELEDWEEDQDLAKLWRNFDTWFILWFDNDIEHFYYNWSLLEKILRNINDEWDLDIYLKYDWRLNEIEYNELIDYFRKNDKSWEILECFNYQISRISYVY